MWYLIISITVISTIGTLFHFLYDLSNHNKIIGLFAAVNESTWEHIKIALTPTILCGLVDGILYGANPNYFLAKATSLLSIILLMPLLFYGHRFVAKKDYFVFDIATFYIVIICSQLAFYFLLQIAPISFVIRYLSCVALFIIFGFYMVLTLLPMKNFLFRDPLTDDYGYDAHSEEFSITKKKNNKQ